MFDLSILVIYNLNDNIYLKSEIEMMFQQMLSESNNKFSKSMAEFDAKFRESMAKFDQSQAAEAARMEKEMLKLENRFEKALNNVMYKIIGTLSGIIILTGALIKLWHYFG